MYLSLCLDQLVNSLSHSRCQPDADDAFLNDTLVALRVNNVPFILDSVSFFSISSEELNML
jgi:hypothetical protein